MINEPLLCKSFTATNFPEDELYCNTLPSIRFVVSTFICCKVDVDKSPSPFGTGTVTLTT